jgi:hypothetical protein
VVDFDCWSCTFSVIAEAHLGLAEANGVLALANAIELLKLCLVDALDWKVSLKGVARSNTIKDSLGLESKAQGL